MGNLLFSPKGRINSGAFSKAAIILIALMFLLSVSSLISVKIGLFLNLIGLIVIWCWIAVWIKRYHDSGRSGWMSLIPIIIWVIGGYILSSVVTNMVVPADLMAEFETSVTEILQTDGFGAMIGEMFNGELAQKISKISTLPTSIAGAVWSALIAFGFNAIIKHQPEENQFGHPI